MVKAFALWGGHNFDFDGEAERDR